MKTKIIFICILLLAFFLRFWKLDIYPPSLNWDEVSIGYNAYSILKTGKDEWGFSSPLSFRAFGDYKLPVFVYSDVLSVGILGLNEWAVRVPSALAGLGIVVVLYFIILRLSGKSSYALWGMFLAACLPWSVFLSRIALEANLALFLSCAAFFSFLVGLNKPRFLILSSLLLGLSLFSYNSSRIVSPILALSWVVIYFKKIKVFPREALISGVLFLSFILLMVPMALLSDSSARYRWTELLDEGALATINGERVRSTLPPAFAKLIHNKVTYFITQSSKNYIFHFNPDFLFLNGGSNYQFNIPQFGLIYIASFPFLVIGIFKTFKEKQRWQIASILWLLTAPIPAAVTRDAPHALRSLMMIPPLIILASLGFQSFLDKIKYNKFSTAVLVIILLISTGVFWQNYTTNYSINYSWAWQYGYKDIAGYIKNHDDKYQQIFVTKKYGEPHEFLLFYLNYKPYKYMNADNLLRYQKSDWYWVDRFDKFVFINDWEIKDKAKCDTGKKCLLITSPGNYAGNWEKVSTVNFLDGKEAFDILEENYGKSI